jgi:S-adenosylmethionine:tRNA ribosyltransferase-isomerase
MTQLKISEYDYDLPGDRIARYPLQDRERSRLLVYSRGKISDTIFKNVTDYIPGNQLMVFNNTRVIQARLKYVKDSGARIEIFCLEPVEPADYESAFNKTGSSTWKCLVGNAGKWKQGALTLHIPDGAGIILSAEIYGREDGTFLIHFSWSPGHHPFSHILGVAGMTPIPPYLERDPEQSDKENYQTVYSKVEGSVAAPTAGFHFTRNILDRLAARGTKIMETTLHIGAGTFRPVLGDDVEAHIMHKEHIYFTMDMLETMLEYQGRITAVGTTSVRTLESAYWLGVKLLEGSAAISRPLTLEQWDAYRLPDHYTFEESIDALIRRLKHEGLVRAEAMTQLMILPGYKFRTLNRIITNFHLPRSTLLLLIAAFVGEDWKKIYRYALNHDFRFLSYGDSSLLSR